MKKIISYIIIIGMIILQSFVPVFASEENDDLESASNISLSEDGEKNSSEIQKIEELSAEDLKIGDKFTINDLNKEYTVVEDDTDQIFINSIEGEESIRLNINHFEVSTEINGKATWRKYVNLSKLCEKSDICDSKVIDTGKYGKTISIERKYEEPIKDIIDDEEIERSMYYVTNHTIGTTKFESRLFVSNGEDTSPLIAGYDNENGEQGKFYKFGDGISEKFDESGESTSVDVESFIDKNSDVYISLRFLSEALGCRVDWLANKTGEDIDAVLIRFYDSDNYCKNMKIKYTELDKTSTEMYDYILENAGKNNFSVNLNIKYDYWDDDIGNKESGSAKWKNIYLGGNALKYNKENLSGTTDEAKLIKWIADKDDLENPLKNRIHFYGETKSDNGEISQFNLACSNNVENGKLSSLEGCVDVTGIMMYYGVPISIKLLTKEQPKCSIDPSTYEKLQ